MKTVFAPGCALNAYKPDTIETIRVFLQERDLIDEMNLTCCKSSQESGEEMTIIDCCPGCGHKFQGLYPNAKVVSLWQVLLETDFPFPNYHGTRMSIHDSCSARNRDSLEMQESARALCQRMNITLVEPLYTRETSHCCGGSAPVLEDRIRMAHARAAEFPEENVVVYCTGCTRSLSITNKQPRHLLDLLFGEPTQGLTIKGL